MKLTTISSNPMATRRRNPLPFPFTRQSRSLLISPKPSKPITLLSVFSSKQSNSTGGEPKVSSFEEGEDPSEGLGEDGNLRVQVGSPVVPLSVLSPTELSLCNQAFFLFAFVACTTSVAFTSLVVADVPTLDKQNQPIGDREVSDEEEETMDEEDTPLGCWKGFPVPISKNIVTSLQTHY